MLPLSVRGIYGGMLGAERIRARRALLRQLREQAAREAGREAARLEGRRDYGRRSEKLRRVLGKAPTTAERYAAGEAGMFRASAGAYYLAHREEIIAKRRASREKAHSLP